MCELRVELEKGKMYKAFKLYFLFACCCSYCCSVGWTWVGHTVRKRNNVNCKSGKWEQQKVKLTCLFKNNFAIPF